MFNWLKKPSIDELLKRIDDIERKVNDHEIRLSSLEENVERGLRRLGGYDYRTEEELKTMKLQVSDLLEAVESLIKHQENKESIARASALGRRLRNNLTRIDRNLKSRAG
ncbi:MAG: hypothetical protein ACOYMG_19855 [Candidatus Methylumidiphilus sp.]